MESKELAAVRETACKALLAVLWLHVPIVLVVGLAAGAPWLSPALLMAALAGVSMVSWNMTGAALQTRLLVAVALVGAASILVYQLAGHAWQIDLHMYFFALLAGLAAFCDFQVILIAAGAIALHHLALNFLLPMAIYPGGGDFGRVVLHAVIVVIESAVLIWLARTLVGLFGATALRVEEAETARRERDRAEAERVESERRAQDASAAALRELGDSFERKVGRIVEAVATAAAEMQRTSSSMSSVATDALGRADAVLSASSAASANVATVASATEELSASIAEIGNQVLRSTTVATKAADGARRTDAVVAGLATDAQKIGEVVTLIQNIASQTNLLALNATIEAARAGEQGKGFAVVAHEVKALANQTAKATEEIAGQIQSIQTATDGVVNAMRSIGGTIGEMSEIAGAISAAIHEQGAVTREIASSITHAATGTEEVNETIQGVQQSSSTVGEAARNVLQAATDLSAQSNQLKAELQGFLASLRQA